MKKTLIVGSALMVLSTAAFASKARLQSLGEDKDGSHFISDYRNVYINPAHLNNLGNRVVAEWGSNGQALGSASIDANATPKAEGGFFYQMPNGMKSGVMLGDESDVSALTRILASTGTAGFLPTTDNVLDLFVAGQGDMNWGANLVYSDSKDEVGATAPKQNALATRFGVSKDAWNAHALVSLASKAENSLANYKGKLGFRLGGGYDLSSENKVFGTYENYTWDQNIVNTASREGNFDKLVAGVGHTRKISDASTLYAKLNGELLHIKLKTSSAAATEAKISRLAIPVTFGFEHSATDWLTVRGSVVQNIHGTVEDSGLTANLTNVAGLTTRALASQVYGSSAAGNGGKKSLTNSTLVNAGMTLKFGKVELDGNIGTSGQNRGTGAVGNNTNNGVLSLDNLESRVGMTYNF